MDMKARIASFAALLALTAALSAAADPQLLSMVMPDAQVVAGVNVDQAKTSPFGQYVLAQIQSNDQKLQDLTALTGFDPRRDVRELLVASPGGNGPNTGLALARGTFDLAKIGAAARTNGAAVETYNGATLVTDPKKNGSLGFLPDGTAVVAGTTDLVKAALNRRSSTTSSISPALSAKVQQWSTSQDAWVVTTVSPASLGPAHGANLPGGVANSDAVQKIDQFGAGVKFASNVAVSAEAQALTAQDAQGLAGVLQFLINLAQTNSAQNPDAAALLKAVTVSVQGQVVKIGLTVPYDLFENLIKQGPHGGRRVKQL